MLAKKRSLSASSSRKWKEKRFACNSGTIDSYSFPEPLPVIPQLLLLHTSGLILIDLLVWLNPIFFYWMTTITTDSRSRQQSNRAKRCSDFAHEPLRPLTGLDDSLQLLVLLVFASSFSLQLVGWIYFYFCFPLFFTTTFAPIVSVCFLYCCCCV